MPLVRYIGDIVIALDIYFVKWGFKDQKRKTKTLLIVITESGCRSTFLAHDTMRRWRSIWHHVRQITVNFGYSKPGYVIPLCVGYHSNTPQEKLPVRQMLRVLQTQLNLSLNLLFQHFPKTLYIILAYLKLLTDILKLALL